MAMKRPAIPPAEAMMGTLLGAAALELEAAADPAAVLVPALEFEEPVPARSNKLGIPISMSNIVHPYQMI
jgi:hypothetical protein